MAKQEPLSLLEWQARFHSEDACREHLIAMRWPEGFVCPYCQHHSGWFIPGYDWFECKARHRHTSITCGTVFHSTKLPLTHWFVALYFVGVDKGGISAQRLSKYLNVSWKTARLMLAN
jgi:Transposase zinc-ribbon domain